MEVNSLKEGTKVSFDYQSIKGTGVIRGISTTPLPIIGQSYIVEIETIDGLKEEYYPYSCLIVYEVFLTVIN